MKDSTFEKYKLVVDEYLVNGMNQTKAYQRYYPDANDKTSSVEFNRILKIPRIKEYYDERMKDAQNELKLTHKDILKELYNWAYSDITETLLLNAEQIKELPKEVRRLITKFKHTKRTFGENNENTEDVIELHFVSKEKAIDMINRHLGFYEADNDQKSATINAFSYEVVGDNDDDDETEN